MDLSATFDPSLLHRLASLAKLRLSQAEEERAMVQLGRLVVHFGAIAAADAESTATEAAAAPSHPLREDVPGPTFSQHSTLANGPETLAGCFRVPRTVDA